MSNPEDLALIDKLNSELADMDAERKRVVIAWGDEKAAHRDTKLELEKLKQNTHYHDDQQIEINKRDGLLCACNRELVPYGKDGKHGQLFVRGESVMHGYDDCYVLEEDGD